MRASGCPYPLLSAAKDARSQIGRIRSDASTSNSVAGSIGSTASTVQGKANYRDVDVGSCTGCGAGAARVIIQTRRAPAPTYKTANK